MIEYNVAQLLKAPTGTIRRVEVDELDPRLVEDLHLVSPTTGALRLMRTTAGILVTGAVSHQVEATCSRCLDTFAQPEVIELNEEFVPVIDVNSGLPAPEPTDPDTFRLTPQHMLDLAEAVRQYTILQAPLQPLCSPDCKGLCVECGANLNLGLCGCQEAAAGAPAEGFGSLLLEQIRRAGYSAGSKSEEE